MSGTALSRSQFLSQVRATFSSVSMPVVSPTVAQMPVPKTELSEVAEPKVSMAQQLDVLDKALTEVEENVVRRAPTVVPAPVSPPIAVLPPQVLEPVAVAPTLDTLAAAIPLAVDQSTQTLNPQQATASSFKEVVPPTPAVAEQPQASMVESAAATPAVEVSGSSAGYQEVGPVSPEIPPEITAYLQEVKNHQEQLPHEIVVNNDDISLQPTAAPLRPVVVLPITPEVEKAGARKSPTMSIRWLVEWSRRLMKMFTGKIVYQES